MLRAHRLHPALALALRYTVAAALGHALWEVGQLPLYTIWSTGTPRDIAVAVIHCTGGDILITATALSIAAALIRLCRWPLFGRRMIFATIAFGVVYAIFSEWLNVTVWRSWAYAAAMPVLPWTGTGLAPLLQWLIVPAVGFAITLGSRRCRYSDIWS